MMRTIFGIIAGYAVMAVVVMVGFIAGPMMLGAEQVFRPGEYAASSLWQWIAVGIGVVGGMAGGATCARVAGRRGAGAILALLVALAGAGLGLAAAPPTSDPPPARPANQPLAELFENAKKHSREPLFTRITNPLAGGVGVWIGATIAASCAARRAGRSSE